MKSTALYMIIFIEGYIVLASEILAIRQTLPNLGAATDSTAIIIAAVLLPLAFGYYKGGQFKPRTKPSGKIITPRKKLLTNFLSAQIFLTLGISYIAVQGIFEAMPTLGVEDRILKATLYSALFLAPPVYLLGQTIPLISHYIKDKTPARLTGRILFVSTLGSLMGAVFSTLVLMAYIGVNLTVIITLAGMPIIIALISKTKFSKTFITSLILFACGWFLNSAWLVEPLNIKASNQHHTMQIFESPNGDRRLMSLNKNMSSIYAEKLEDRAPYAEYIERIFLRPLENKPPIDILVIGAGGFVIGVDDTYNRYTYLDINPDLQDWAETYLLQKPLTANKRFESMGARAFLTQYDMQFDLIILDVFNGNFTAPEYLITREFFQSLKDALSPKGILIANFANSPNLSDALSRNLDATFRSVFTHYNREILAPYDPWSAEAMRLENVLLTYFNTYDGTPPVIYTDDKRRPYADRFKTPE